MENSFMVSIKFPYGNAVLVCFSYLCFPKMKRYNNIPVHKENIIMLRHIESRTELLSLLKEDRDRYFLASVNGKVRELSFVIDKPGDYDIEFYDCSSTQGAKVYTASIRYLASMAAKIIAPKASFRFYFNISRALFVKSVGSHPYRIDPEFVEKLSRKMKELVEEDIPLTKVRVSKEDAVKLYQQLGFKDKISVIKYRSENYVHLYQAKNKEIEYYDYLYSPLVPSTRYLREFVLRYYAPGMIIQVPRSECQGQIPPFVDESKFSEALQSNSHWEDINHLDTVSHINRFIKTYSSLALINVCEARINSSLAQLGNEIARNEVPIRLVCIAGPSSSGKNSFANRLMYQLMMIGLRPIRISMDDYFIPTDKLPKNVSLESVDALDINLFNTQMDELVRGKSVVLPLYNFKDHQREQGRKVSLSADQPIIIEGIHALNDVVCSNIPNTTKYKIYIAPQPQVNIDDHTPISMTDMRLLRRIARDSRTRSTDALNTIRMWPSVRKGEFKYIYPTQENADFVFDSFMPYELCAIRNIVLPQLEKITPEEKEYYFANSLKNMVKYFLPIGTSDIPCNSLMREFVGGSSFNDAR